MTVRLLIDVLLRRRVFVLAALLLLCSLLTIEWRASGVYWTRFDVVLLPPKDSASPNSLAGAPVDLSATAAVLALKFNHGLQTSGPASSSVTMIDEGVRSGHVVRLRNYGGQWRRDYTRPVIDVQVAGASPEEVSRSAREIAHRLAAMLAKQQSAMDVPERQMITTTAASDDPVVSYQGGARTRALAATSAAGLSATATLAVLWDRRRSRKRETR